MHPGLGLGRAATTDVGRAEAHALDCHGRRGIAFDRGWRSKPDELHTLFLGMSDFAPAAGHVGAVATVEAFDRRCALADGGADTVHRRVAAADDDDALACGVEPGDRLAETPTVGGEQIV